LTKQDTKNRHQKTTPQHGESEHGKKQQQTKTTKHTIEFSNNRLAFVSARFRATLPVYFISGVTSTRAMILFSRSGGLSTLATTVPTRNRLQVRLVALAPVSRQPDQRTSSPGRGQPAQPTDFQGPYGPAPGGYCTRSMSAPSPTSCSTNNG